MQQPTPYQLDELQEKVSSGQANPAEQQLYARWLSQLEIKKNQLTDQEIEQRRLAFAQRFEQHFLPLPKVRNLYRWLPAAAAALIIITVGGLLFFNRQQPVRYTDVFTRSGERKVITLPDGSQVTLHNASHIRFPQAFADTLRDVQLEGEAFFEVRHQLRQPFVVSAEQLKVTVLGTSFDVRVYRREPASVTVASGKVGVISHGRTWLLLPDQQWYEGKTTLVRAGDYTAWRQGEQVFKNESIEAISKRLERWYGVRIIIKNEELKNKRLRFRLHNESLATVLKQMGLAGGFTYQQQKKGTYELIKI